MTYAFARTDDEGDEDMSLDPCLVLMEDRPNREIALEVLEGLFHRDQLQIIAP
jgi:hypothetical protein